MPVIEKKFIEVSNGNYDYAIIDGDFLTDDSFDTDILSSLLVDARADSSEIQQPENRRGWFGDEFMVDVGFILGSKLWLIEQSRNVNLTATQAETYTREALEWILDKKLADTIDVSTELRQPDELFINIAIFVDDNKIASFTFELWKNSKYAS